MPLITTLKKQSQADLSLRPAWSTELVLGQLGLSLLFHSMYMGGVWSAHSLSTTGCPILQRARDWSYNYQLLRQQWELNLGS